ncbi:MAG: NHLP bacteriocin system secretion protein [Candidatus Riflebacteria bacterium]|nr:NHLP bacteriocin system secretion protein [Candidatus Riflebacteria bacterium]
MSLFGGDSKQIFRQAALDRLASPEQTDRLDMLLPRNAWFILAGFLVFVILGLSWGIYGRIPTTVSGTGILLSPEGVMNILSTSNGTLVSLKVKNEAVVKAGDLLAEIEHPELSKEISAAHQRLAELSKKKETSLLLQKREKESVEQLIKMKLAAASDTVKNYEKQIVLARQKAEQQKDLIAKGLITRQALLETEKEIQSVEGQIRELRNQQKQVEAESMDLGNRQTREGMGVDAEIAEQTRSVEMLEKRRELNSKIYAPTDGRIVEIMAAEHSVITQGQPILSLESIKEGAKKLEAYLYIPMREGKQIQPGMNVQIVPGAVKRQEFGFVCGKIISVSPLPATENGMQSVLGNLSLVRSLMNSGPLIAIRAELLTDPASPSGLKWSSGKGPELIINSGTSCDASVVTREQAPVTLVIPVLKEYLGL